MEVVKAYKTSDAKVFASPAEAYNHEFKIRIQGFFNTRAPVNNNNTIAVPDIARAIEKDVDVMASILIQHRKALKRVANPKPYKPRQKRLTAGTVSVQINASSAPQAAANLP